MSTTSDALDQIRTIIHSLETTRDALSNALVTPECDDGAPAAERPRIEDLHHRIIGALAALHGGARDY